MSSKQPSHERGIHTQSICSNPLKYGQLIDAKPYSNRTPHNCHVAVLVVSATVEALKLPRKLLLINIKNGKCLGTVPDGSTVAQFLIQPSKYRTDMC